MPKAKSTTSKAHLLPGRAQPSRKGKKAASASKTPAATSTAPQRPRLPRCEELREELAAHNASAPHLNYHNFESPWRQLFFLLLLRAAMGSPATVSVRSEHDLYLHSAEELMAADATTDFERYSVLACRPDVVVGFNILEKVNALYKVSRFKIAVIAELKRAPERTLVDQETGHPFSEEGSRAIEDLTLKAQRQVVRQGALYFRTLAGKTQKKVLLVAGTALNASVAIMWKDRMPDYDLEGEDSDRMVRSLSDYRAVDAEEQLRQFRAPAESAVKVQGEKLPRPRAPAGGGLRWHGSMNPRGGQFHAYVTDFIREFERENGVQDVSVTSLHKLRAYRTSP